MDIPESTLIDLRVTSNPVAVHLLPCCIEHDGPANVQRFFKPKESGTSESGILSQEVSLRGRKLMGCSLSLPEGYIGYVLQKVNSEGNAGSPKKWETAENFEALTYWNHDLRPHPSDELQKLFEFLNVASKAQMSITQDEVDKMLSSMKVA